MSEYASSNHPKPVEQTDDMLDFELIERDDFMADTFVEQEVADLAARRAAERAEYNAYEDLGGRPGGELTLEQKKAMVRAGLGSKAMRLEVARVIQAETDAAQHKVNQDYAERIRQEAIERDRQNGIDVDSAEYQAKLRLQAERRKQRF